MFPDVFFISGSPYSSWALSKACAAQASRAIVLAQAAAAGGGEAAGAADGVDPDAETIFVLQVCAGCGDVGVGLGAGGAIKESPR